MRRFWCLLFGCDIISETPGLGQCLHCGREFYWQLHGRWIRVQWKPHAQEQEE